MNLIELVKRNTCITQCMLDTELENILRVVCSEMNTSIITICTSSRKRELSDARFIYFYIAKQLTKKTVVEIGSMVMRDHSTVIHGIKEVKRLGFLNKKAEEVLKLFNYANNTQ